MHYVGAVGYLKPPLGLDTEGGGGRRGKSHFSELLLHPNCGDG